MRTAGPAAVMIGLLIRFDCGARQPHVPLREGGFLLDECPRRVPELPHHAGTWLPHPNQVTLQNYTKTIKNYTVGHFGERAIG
jgi:hypothetical protein